MRAGALMPNSDIVHRECPTAWEQGWKSDYLVIVSEAWEQRSNEDKHKRGQWAASEPYTVLTVYGQSPLTDWGARQNMATLTLFHKKFWHLTDVWYTFLNFFKNKLRHNRIWFWSPLIQSDRSMQSTSQGNPICKELHEIAIPLAALLQSSAAMINEMPPSASTKRFQCRFDRWRAWRSIFPSPFTA